MRVAFYAPLKAPDHPVPSGDRLLARALLQALRGAGHRVRLASRLRTWEGAGDAARQVRLQHAGEARAARLIRRWRADAADAPQLWFTYHLYHKAPDWLGPAVSAALDIPYVVAEASVADKQEGGAWHPGHRSAVAAIRAADALVCVNPVDLRGLARLLGGDARLHRLPPFMDLATFVGSADDDAAAAAVRALDLPAGTPRLITVAMMRAGRKQASFEALAATLARLRSPAWHLVVVGDGAARAAVQAAFARWPTGRVRFVGLQPSPVVAALLRSAELFVWPAIDEVFGMTLIEAQACGVPIVAGHTPGVASVVAEDRSALLAPAGDIGALAAAVDRLLDAPARRRAMGEAARAHAQSRHALPSAAAALDAILSRAVEVHAARRQEDRPGPGGPR